MLLKKLTFFVCILLSTPLFASGNDGYRISVKVKHIQDTVAYLGYPYGDKKYVQDTAAVQDGNTFVFEGGEPLEAGMYFFYTPGDIYFELIGDSDRIDITTDTTDLVANMEVKGSYSTQAFRDFQLFMKESKEKAMELTEKMKSDPGQKEKYQAEMQALDSKVKNYRQSLIDKRPEAFVSKLIKATTEIDVPEAPASLDQQAGQQWRYRYYKEHFLDNIDFSEPGMLRTPVFHQKIDEYLEKMTYKHPDSISEAAHTIIEKCKANKEVFRYCVVTLSNKYETSNIMGMDGVFVDLAESYYLTGEAYWADSALVAKIAKRVQELRPLIGDTAPDFIARDTLMQPVSLYGVDARYTVLYFYSPDCGHCKKKTPVLRKLYNEELKDMDVEVFAMVSDTGEEMVKEWKKFIKEHDLNWVNAADPYTQSNFRADYYIDRTPKVYVLDQDNQIIAKRLDVEQIPDFISKQIELSKAQ